LKIALNTKFRIDKHRKRIKDGKLLIWKWQR
jgi:hypothetical protein